MPKLVLCIPDNLGACGFYRAYAPMLTLESFAHCNGVVGGHIQYAQSLSGPQDRFTTFYLQRWLSDPLREYFDYLQSLRRKTQARIVYDIDDLLIHEEIPDCNRHKRMIPERSDNLRYFLEHADCIGVSTPLLRDELARRFDRPRERFVVMRNRIPYWWGGMFDEERSLRNYRESRKRPRVVFCCSDSHVDAARSGAPDDFTEYIAWIVENLERYEIIFVGCLPPALLPYGGRIRVYPPIPVISYMAFRRDLRATVYVQPLRDSLFNRCKSDIKLLEGFAEGVPVLTRNLCCYERNSPALCFSSPEELDAKIQTLLGDENNYRSAVRFGAQTIAGTYLEQHIEEWSALLDFPIRNS